MSAFPHSWRPTTCHDRRSDCALPCTFILFVGVALYAYFVGVAISESSVLGDIYDTYWIKGGSIDLLGHGGNPPSVH